ncbi:MAG TPA: precorrin-6A synthase (deacetylating) [Solirubrobacteraceae bacterium]|jgi:precorrin-6A synthase|nr:precorrin-6A synthase (deacetylating) [Solirubrobacteraceae bacterium]
MRRILAIGIGAGDLEHMTVGAIRALNEADVLFEIERGVGDLTAVREQICRRYIEPGRRYRTVAVPEPARDRAAGAYGAAVEEWRARRAEVWEEMIEQELAPEECGAFLVWGDPSLYDSTIAVLDGVQARGRTQFELEVVPGISSVQALAARHRIALNRIGGAVLVTTGRRLRERGFPAGVDDVVVMLDADCSFRRVDPDGVEIYWGAYLGTEDEILVAGPLAEVAAEIEARRAQGREGKGWIMDCYLLRRQRARAAE